MGIRYDSSVNCLSCKYCDIDYTKNERYCKFSFEIVDEYHLCGFYMQKEYVKKHE